MSLISSLYATNELVDFQGFVWEKLKNGGMKAALRINIYLEFRELICIVRSNFLVWE